MSRGNRKRKQVEGNFRIANFGLYKVRRHWREIHRSGTNRERSDANARHALRLTRSCIVVTQFSRVAFVISKSRKYMIGFQLIETINSKWALVCLFWTECQFEFRVPWEWTNKYNASWKVWEYGSIWKSLNFSPLGFLPELKGSPIVRLGSYWFISLTCYTD